MIAIHFVESYGACILLGDIRDSLLPEVMDAMNDRRRNLERGGCPYGAFWIGSHL